MNNFDKNKLNDPRVAQIIDANLDRAREGLRVLEDWARFGLGREDFVKKIKNYRQILGKHHLLIYKEARNFINDECTGMAHPEQLLRNRTESIIFSNAARVQEALRVIEEFSRNHNRELSIAASRIRYEIYKLEIALINCENNRFRLKILQENDLYLITMNCDDLIGKIRNILEGGVKIIQYRAKDGNDLKNLVEAKKIRELCTKFEALFIVNDRIDLALASDADGIHLGQEDIDIKSARKILGFSKIIGVSAGKESEIKNAIRDGCDYLGIGAIFLSTTKKNKIPLGIDEIRRISKDINIPWFAIGGIKVENIPSLKANGIKKVAIISDLLNSENPKEKAMMLIKALSNENKS
tara:strand:+ start:352 stop:1413 length:1062 start_codon:yes stop_codon:yes gene_type:complete